MTWSAKILEKSEVSATCELSYTFIVLGDDKELQTFSVTADPSTIQQVIEEKVKEFAVAYELADSLPGVGDEIKVIV